jgi:hypothetical protein
MQNLTKVVLGICALFSIGSAQAVDQIYVDGGTMLHPTGKSFPSVIDAGLGWNLPWSSSGGTLSSRLDLGLGLIRSKENNIWLMQAMPVLRYKPAAAQNGVFTELGIGLTYINKTTFATGHDMGSHLQFEERLGVGYDYFGYAVSINLSHISNAGLAHPNPGADIASIRYTQTF